MPEEKNEPMIDVGEAEGAEIDLNSEKESNHEQEQAKETENEKLEVVEDTSESNDTSEKSSEQSNVQADTDQKKDNELKEYSDGVQKRIAKLTRKMREAERQREEAIAFAQTEKKRREDLEGRFSKLDQSYVSEFEARVKNSLTAAKQALKTAIENQDVEAQVSAQQQIASLTMDEARLQGLKSKPEETVKEEKDVKINPQRTNQDRTADPKAEAWASKNPWFGSDSAMTYTAFDLHKKLTEEEGYDPQSDEYYTEIDKRIKLEFPHKFGKVEDNSTERAKPAQTVASANRPSITGRRKTVKLTPSQVAIAKRLGVPLEEYAKQLTTKEA